jgi:phospholipase C
MVRIAHEKGWKFVPLANMNADMLRIQTALFALGVSALLAACAHSGTIIPPANPANSGSADVAMTWLENPQSAKIQHVVVIMQENRSFDNLFQGYPGADTVSSGKDTKGDVIPLQPITLESPYGIDHAVQDFFAACDGTGSIRGTHCKMDGFDHETTYGSSPPKNLPYGYVPHRETKLYFEMAREYVLADRMFTSHIDESFISHQYIIAAQAQHGVNDPAGGWGCGYTGAQERTLKPNRKFGPYESPCFNSKTIGDELDAKGLSWRYYASDPGDLGSLWIAYRAIKHIYDGSDWKNVITPETKFLSDVHKGKLSAVTWITPTCKTSDHAICLSNLGPDWVADVVNSVGESPFWKSTVIFVMWDEWGGWYDHVPPPYLDYDGLGIRVPLLVISPYAKRNYVSHIRYEHGSIVRFIEDTFGLARLAVSDRRAHSPAIDCFDFSQKPRAFKPLATAISPSIFLNAPLDPRPPDDD